MKFSVIIPTFNRAHVLLRAVKSVINQTYSDFDLWIIDDGSTDGTQSIIGQYIKEHNLLERITYIKTPNAGVSAARNLGIKLSRGEWIAFLDSDDEWFDFKLEEQAKYLKANKEKLIVHTQEQWIRNGVRVNQMKKHQKAGGDIFEQSLKMCAMSPSSIVLRRDLFSRIGYFREDYPVCEDYDLWLKLVACFEVGYIQKACLKKFGGDEDQLSRQYKAMDYYRVKSMAWVEKNNDLSPLRRSLLLKILNKKCHILLKGYHKHKNYTHFYEIEEIKKSYEFSPAQAVK